MDLKRGRAWEVWLTLLLWRACSSVAQKLKQRQGTPASLAHWMYLWRGQVLLSLPPSTQSSSPPHPTPGFQYLALLGTSGLVLSITTCFPCLSAAWHELTQRCHDPSVSYGTQDRLQSVWRVPPQEQCSEGGYSPTHPVYVDVSSRQQVFLDEGGLASCGEVWPSARV